MKSLARQGVRPDKTRPSSSSSMTKGRRTATDDDDDDAIPRDANAMEHVAAGPPPTRCGPPPHIIPFLFRKKGRGSRGLADCRALSWALRGNR